MTVWLRNLLIMAAQTPFDKDMDLGADLDVLIAQIREKQPDSVAEVPAAPAQEISPFVAKIKTESETGSAPGEQLGAPDGVDGLVAQQVNEQINGESDHVGDTETSGSEPDQQFARQVKQLIDEAAASAEPATEQPVGQGDSASVAQIDDLLAERADDAVAGDFETVNDVLAAWAAEPQAVSAEPGADTVEVVAADGAAGAELDVTGDLDRPKDVVVDEGDRGPCQAEVDRSVAAAEPEFNATAQDVARELDEQPEFNATADPTQGTVRWAPRPKPVVVASAGVLRHGCGLANWPIRQLSVGSQNMIGYVGLLLLFPGTIMCCYGVIRLLLGG